MPADAQNFAMKLISTDLDPNFGHRLCLGTDCRKELGGRLNSSIIHQLEGYQNRCLGAWKRNLDPGECLPMNFEPGERQQPSSLGKLYQAMGVLRSPDIIQCYGRDFISPGVSDTATKIQQKLKSQDHQGKMVIILSGLKADMAWLMSTWPILLAFFGEQVVFENTPPQDCLSMLVRELDASKIVTETSFLKDRDSSDLKRVDLDLRTGRPGMVVVGGPLSHTARGRRFGVMPKLNLWMGGRL
ncbi:cbxX protein [Zalerion maritima]|uniref:CbxX protein n=1 Tax=Zalerion maritima TaxID=339359 RepID=A0AAD5RNU9_9PEZI|nr:cbxX protein [Zalerion maritima]